MKIVTWNINGIRTFKGGIKKALDLLDADIICLQETKVTRDLLDERTAIVDGYNSYFSFCRGRSGYSGVATYCKNSATPFAAEEGLTGLLTNHEGTVGCYGDQKEFASDELQLLDNEGRAVITQHKISWERQMKTITIVNVYCPRADPEKPERKQFKLQFYKLLQCRAEAILEAGSHVIVLGDVNTSHQPIDHCDPTFIDRFEENPGRKWLNGFLHIAVKETFSDGQADRESDASERNPIHSGRFLDTFRHFHPSRSNAFTCWSTLTGARQTNYGTRIDYIFADLWLTNEQFVGTDIMPEVEGSDHCPVWGELKCSLLPSPNLPPLCSRHLPEFTGKQQKLSRFLVKFDQQPAKEVAREVIPSSQEAGERRENLNPIPTSSVLGKKKTVQLESATPKSKKSKIQKAPAKSQGNLLAFFKPQSTKVVPPVEPSATLCEKALGGAEVVNSSQLLTEGCGAGRTTVTDRDTEGNVGVCEGDTDLALASTTELPTSGSFKELSGPKKVASSGFWKTVLRGPPQPPPCKFHGEPCVLRTVKKPGPTMGKQFFVCARPQGHASNPDARCNFFVWVERGNGK